MNHYEILAQSYEQLLQNKNQQYNEENIKAQIVALRLIASKTQEEIGYLFDTGAFNEICREYFLMAMENCGIKIDVQKEIINEVDYLFDILPVNEIKNIEKS